MNEREHERLEELYEQARALGAEARSSFIAETCTGNPELEGELTSLLDHGESAEAFFAMLSEVVVSPSVGHRIGQYQLVGMLGNGGMGTVYRAHDDRLDRFVALKFLPPYLSAQPGARERFLAEARAAAALDHPNVCSIHEIGETTDGRPFIAMTCYEGETLKERLNRELIPTNEAIRIAIALGQGLGAAHARGIVHRDVKPGNVMLCADGTVRLLDFGLAKAADISMVGPGATQGTLAYMSPEQAAGHPVDARSDLWSVGVVLYEMLAGTRPFRGDNGSDVIQEILHGTPDPLPTRLGTVPVSLRRIVTCLLHKSPEERYRSASELVQDLSRRAPARNDAVIAIGVVSVTAILTLSLLARRVGTVPTSIDPSASSLTIAVLPFTVRGAGLDVWREGMVDLLSIGLDGAAGLRAIDSRTLLARWHQEIGDTTAADLESALRVARRSDARYALVGTVVAAGPRLRLSADIYDVATGRSVGPVQVEGPADSVLVLVDRVGMQTLGVILEKNAVELPTLDLADFTTNSLFALKAYLEGTDHYRRSEFPLAINAWERAVRADTLFALAELGLADAYAWMGDHPRFMVSLNRAKHLEARLPRRERAMMQIRWERETGVGDVLPTVREAIRQYPDAADMWYQLGEVYYHDAVAMGRSEDAEAAFRNAVKLQPLMAPYREHLLDLTFQLHPDSAHLARELAAHARLAPQDASTLAGGIVLALGFGDSVTRARARAELRTVDSETGRQVYHYLAHSIFAELRDGVFRDIEPRLNAADRMTVQEARVRNLGLTDGRLRDALAVLDDARTAPRLRYAGTLYLSARGIPVSEQVLKQVLAAARGDSSLYESRFAAASAAGAAARLADWATYNTLVSRLRDLAARGRAAGDAERASYWDWAVLVAEAHGLWQQGRTDEALRRFESSLVGDPRWFTLWNFAELSLELGRLDQAERAFRALLARDGTPAYLQLARILTRTGRAEEARDAYRVVADAWRHADPELQLQVDEANRAIGRR